VPRIFDNKTEQEQLAPALRATLEQALALDACVGYLNLRGWRQIADSVETLEGKPGRPPARILVGMAARPDQLVRRAYRLKRDDEDDRVTNKEARQLEGDVLTDFREQLLVGAPSSAQEQALRQFRDQLADNRVRVKFFARYPLHAKLYLGHLKSGQLIPLMGFVGSSNLTFSGLVGQGELNVDVPDKDGATKLLEWFKERWDDDLAIDVTDELIKILDESWVSADQPRPYLVYLKLAYELSSDAREGLRDYEIPASLRDILLDHQADAVRVAARIVERRGGVMIGDVVGLGKTLTATAIARVMQEQHGIETLVIAPKNLVRMWDDHLQKYRVHGKVVSLSMAHRELEQLVRYRLVIVDESHNLRNPQTQQWQAVRSYIERNDPRVVLLTGTPYNKAFTDAAGQLRLWLPQDLDLGVRPERQIDAEGELAVAKHADGRLTSLKAFEPSPFAEDWQRLMSLFLVRRTRRFIEQRYGETGPDGRIFLRFADGTPFYFPTRVPQPLTYAGGRNDPGDRLASTETVDTLNRLQLPRYRLGDFLVPGLEAATQPERDAIERLERARGNLQGFIRTTLMKRLSSCGQSFLISVERHLLRNHVALHALEAQLPLPLGTVENGRWDALSDDDDPDELPLGGLATHHTAAERSPGEWAQVAANRYQALTQRPPAGLSWIDTRFFTADLPDAIRADDHTLQTILDDHSPWDPDADSKIDALQRLITEIHPDEKVLVFSEYADTAKYVGDTLKKRLPDVAIESVTGATTDPTVPARRFSPMSNATLGGLPHGQAELQILVATDVLSEGQNLQDAAIVANYDLPWTIIRLIQRAGRVDRVGQESPRVDVYSFLPQEGVESVIKLRKRIAQRLRENAAVFGSDEQFFDDELSDDLVRGLFDGSASLEEAETTEDVDWASQALAIWQSGNDAEQKAAIALPNVTYSTRARRPGDGHGGVLVYTRTTRGIDGLAWTEPSAAAPTRILTPFEALRVAACAPEEPPSLRRDDHHTLVEQAIKTTLIESARQPLAITHSGIRARLYRLLDNSRKVNEGTFFDTPELRKLIEAVYHQPLKDTAKHRIARAIRERTPDDVAALAQDLDTQDELLVDLDDRTDDLHIVCSLGVTET
jgi:superfamily II DNA or RNA helicase